MFCVLSLTMTVGQLIASAFHIHIFKCVLLIISVALVMTNSVYMHLSQYPNYCDCSDYMDLSAIHTA
jgi:hypothetical protein